MREKFLTNLNTNPQAPKYFIKQVNAKYIFRFALLLNISNSLKSPKWLNLRTPLMYFIHRVFTQQHIFV